MDEQRLQAYDEQRIQAYRSLIEQLMWCNQGEETAVLQQQDSLVDAGLLEVIALEMVQLERQRKAKVAQRLQQIREIAAGLVANPQGRVVEEPIRETAVTGLPGNAEEFLARVLLLVGESQGDAQRVYAFLRQHQDSLNESLLKALPQVTALLHK